MQTLTSLCRARTLMWAALLCTAMGLTGTRASAEALLVIEVDTGKVLYAQNAGYPWYPASVTKLMTAYVTLHAVKDGRITFDQPLTVSANAVAQSPVKMGFGAGTQVTVDNALKMMMVKSANDIAVVLAEGVGGSIEGFADLMNWHARHLGMAQSTFVNPNGLPADDQVSSARDLAILARALIREFPEYDYYWHLPGIRMGKMVQRNYNTLLGRYPGADGMKTGFICAAGFNLVASATRNGKRLIAVVLGAPSSAVRALKAAQLLERGFSSTGGLGWLMPSQGTVETIAADRGRAAQPARRDVRPASQAPRDGRRGRHYAGKCRTRFALRRIPFEPASVQGEGCAAAGREHRRAGPGVYRDEAAGAGCRVCRFQAASRQKQARQEESCRRETASRRRAGWHSRRGCCIACGGCSRREAEAQEEACAEAHRDHPCRGKRADLANALSDIPSSIAKPRGRS